MKAKLFLFLASLLFVAGCDKITDAATITIKTHLKGDLPLAITAPVGTIYQEGAYTAPITFSGTGDINLDQNTDISQYLDKIKEIDINSITFTVTGLTADQTINSLTVDVVGVGNLISASNITMTNNTYTPQISQAILDQISSKLQNEHKLTVSVSGSVSGTMSVTLKVDADTEFVVFLLK